MYVCMYVCMHKCMFVRANRANPIPSNQIMSAVALRMLPNLGGLVYSDKLEGLSCFVCFWFHEYAVTHTSHVVAIENGAGCLVTAVSSLSSCLFAMMTVDGQTPDNAVLQAQSHFVRVWILPLKCLCLCLCLSVCLSACLSVSYVHVCVPAGCLHYSVTCSRCWREGERGNTKAPIGHSVGHARTGLCIHSHVCDLFSLVHR